MHPELLQLKGLLDGHYLRNMGPVGYIDESYRDSSRADEYPFYTMTATVILAQDVCEFRDEYMFTAGGKWWHTTTMFQRKEVELIRRFSELLMSHGTTAIIAVQVDIKEGNMEHARRECLLQLIARLGNIGCNLVVYERREDNISRNADASLISKAKGSGFLSRQISVFAGDPGMEPLLWGPDLVGWALRRHLALGDSIWIQPFVDNLELIDVSKNGLLKTKEPQPAAAKGCGSGTSVDLEGEGKIRSSKIIMARCSNTEKNEFGMFTKISTPEHTSGELSAWLSKTFPKSRPPRN